LFSSDSKHLVYKIKEDNKKYFVYDNQEKGGYIDVAWAIFSPDSKHFVYWADEKDNSSKWHIINDGQREEFYMWGIYDMVFSPDSKHLSYITKSEQMSPKMVFYDDQRIESYDHIVNLTFSPDSQHLVYILQKRSEIYSDDVLMETIGYDGQRMESYDRIYTMQINKDNFVQFIYKKDNQIYFKQADLDIKLK
jgi:hypothetical protein